MGLPMLRGEIRLTDLGPAGHVYPFQVLLNAAETGLRVDSKAQGEQTRSVSVERLGQVIGRVPAHQVAQLDDALRIHLPL